MDDKDQIIKTLLEKIVQLEAIVAEQSAIIAKQAVKIAELEKRLNKNSRNSSKPPSSDGLSKPRSNASSLRKKGKNKSGEQPGHEGKTLKRTSTPDKIERHSLTQCPSCSTSLASEKVQGVVGRQVFDLPQPKVEVTEHQAEIKICPFCQKKVTATFPQNVCSPTQYGQVIKSYALYLQQQFIPEDRLQKTFRDLFNIPLSTATLSNMAKGLYDKLSTFKDAMATRCFHRKHDLLPCLAKTKISIAWSKGDCGA